MTTASIEQLDWDEISGRNDPRQRFRIYRLCEGIEDPQLVATCETPQAVGVTLVELGREGEWDDCPVGVLDVMGEPGLRWIFRPWLPNPTNITEAGRMLRTARADVPDEDPKAAYCPTCHHRVRLTVDGRIFKHRTGLMTEFEYCASSGNVHPSYLKGK